jgi:hypothetical protein
MTAATFRPLRSSQSRDACRTRSARSGATKSITIAIANGNNDTSEKKSQSTMYCVVLGLVSEMSLSAKRDKPTRIGERRAGANNRNDRRTGDLAHLRHHALDPFRICRPPKNTHHPHGQNNRRHDVHDRDPRLGLRRESWMRQHRRSRTRRRPQSPTSRSAHPGRTTGRYAGAGPPTPSASTENDNVVGDNIAASATSTSSASIQPTCET